MQKYHLFGDQSVSVNDTRNKPAWRLLCMIFHSLHTTQGLAQVKYCGLHLRRQEPCIGSLAYTY